MFTTPLGAKSMDAPFPRERGLNLWLDLIVEHLEKTFTLEMS
jgi:hypothetical protein